MEHPHIRGRDGTPWDCNDIPHSEVLRVRPRRKNTNTLLREFITFPSITLNEVSNMRRLGFLSKMRISESNGALHAGVMIH